MHRRVTVKALPAVKVRRVLNKRREATEVKVLISADKEHHENLNNS